MKDILLQIVGNDAVVNVVAGLLATALLWAIGAIVARYKDRAWAQALRKYSPLAVDAFLRAEKAIVSQGANPQDSKALAFAERFAAQFRDQYGKEPSGTALDVAETIKAELLLNSKN